MYNEGCIFLFERKLWSCENFREIHTINCSSAIIQLTSITQYIIRQEEVSTSLNKAIQYESYIRITWLDQIQEHIHTAEPSELVGFKPVHMKSLY